MSKKRSFLSFEGSREFAWSLNLKGKVEWAQWVRSGNRPANVPAAPDRAYAKKGWNGWGDFLGTGKIANQSRAFLSFEDARAYARSLRFTKHTQWKEWAKSEARPDNIPSYPNETYEKKGWISYGDFLGSEIVSVQNRIFRPFEEAKAYARSLRFKSQTEWRKWAKTENRPKNVTNCPSATYASDWKGWGDFLGTGVIAHRDRKYRTFDETKAIVTSLGLKNTTEWREWAKSPARPQDIPAVPDRIYARKGWSDWGDFLGTGFVANQNREYRLYKKAKAYVRQLGLENQKEWGEWAKSPARPKDMPIDPPGVYVENGWGGWGDFLGTGYVANQKRVYRPFQEARTFARSLGFKNREDWELWRRSKDRLEDIPALPSKTYANDGWLGWGDFLGTDNVAPRNLKFRPFENARSYVRSLGFKTKTDWIKWSQSANRPKDIPRVPERTYAEDGWNGYEDFLGAEIVSNQSRVYRSFDEARTYAKSLSFKSRSEWNKWAQSSARPKDIPVNPEHLYKSNGWKGWGDFLGTGTIATKNYFYRPFEEARAYARSLGFKGREDWELWRKLKDKPKDIPSVPERAYADKGWNGWGDWLGVFNNWNINNIRAFVSSLFPHLDSLSAAGLYVLFQQTGIFDMDRGSKGRSFVQALKTGRFPKEELEKFVNGEASLVDEFLENSALSLENHTETPIQAPEDSLPANETIIHEELPSIDTKGILATLDSKLFSTLDREAVDFFIKESVARIWQHAFLNEAEAVQQLEQYHHEGVYSEEVRRLFFDDYRGAKALELPLGYSFPHQPNLMQRYTAYLVKSRKRLGNWSGTGAGKTLSAILASRVIGAELTVICCPNSVIDNWQRNIKSIYPASTLLIKDTDFGRGLGHQHQYMILNYEFFQQPNAESKLKALLEKHRVDFIIIDEIHYSKQREAEKISLRKSVISAFLSEASIKNDNFHVLGMSATPVINNLFEGKTLIELVTGVHHDELNTKATVPNCISHYQKFVSHGIRWVPQYQYKLNQVTEYIDCSSFIPQIKHQSLLGSMVDLEAILTQAKLPFILENLRSKTIVYTHYIKDIVSVLQEAIELRGWRVAIFTGDNKDGLAAFVDGNADILIASSCVGTGVDRLQHVCNRLIVNALPWTHAEFEQLRGRLYRQGQKSDHVDVIVPLTFADINGERRSWCESRWKRILFK